MTTPLKYMRLNVVGGFYQVGVEWSKLHEGDRVELVPEPDNVADVNAVAVIKYDPTIKQPQRIGYLAREVAALFGPMLTNKFVRVKARLVAIDPWVERRRSAPIMIECEIEKLV